MPRYAGFPSLFQEIELNQGGGPHGGGIQVDQDAFHGKGPDHLARRYMDGNPQPIAHDMMGRIEEELIIENDAVYHPDLVNIGGPQAAGLSAQGGWNPVNLLVALVPAKTIVGRDMDALTEVGVAHVLLASSLLVLIGIAFFFFIRSYWYNRRGYRGQVRQLSNEYYNGKKHEKVSSPAGGWFSRLLPLRGGKSTSKKKKEM